MATEDKIREALLRERLAQVQDAIAQAAREAGRLPETLTLIGVSKQFPPETALAGYRVGIRDLGENRVQDLLAKQQQLEAAGARPNWHMIGTLQRNKVRQLIGRVCLIHSVDSIVLLEEISKRSQKAGITTEILLQVNSTGEACKHGFAPQDLEQAVEMGQTMPGLHIRGMMTMAQLTGHPDETLPVFARTRALFDRIGERLDDPATWAILSMGMSQDYLQAIRCGATHLRIGSALFGARPGS